MNHQFLSKLSFQKRTYRSVSHDIPNQKINHYFENGKQYELKIKSNHTNKNENDVIDLYSSIFLQNNIMKLQQQKQNLSTKNRRSLVNQSLFKQDEAPSDKPSDSDTIHSYFQPTLSPHHQENSVTSLLEKDCSALRQLRFIKSPFRQLSQLSQGSNITNNHLQPLTVNQFKTEGNLQISLDQNNSSFSNKGLSPTIKFEEFNLPSIQSSKNMCFEVPKLNFESKKRKQKLSREKQEIVLLLKNQRYSSDSQIIDFYSLYFSKEFKLLTSKQSSNFIVDVFQTQLPQNIDSQGQIESPTNQDKIFDSSFQKLRDDSPSRVFAYKSKNQKNGALYQIINKQQPIKLYVCKNVLMNEEGRRRFQREISFYQRFSKQGEERKEQIRLNSQLDMILSFETFGINSLDNEDKNIQNSCELNNKGYIILEHAGSSLFKCLYSTKIETIDGRKLKIIQPTSLHQNLIQDKQYFLKLLKQIALFIQILEKNEWSYNNLRLDNIFINTQQILNLKQIKLIGFSNSYCPSNHIPFETITSFAEYLPPEILELFQQQNCQILKRESRECQLIHSSENKEKNPEYLISQNTIDVWSYGCLLFEMLIGVRINETYWCKLKNSDLITGIFSSKKKTIQQIIEKQEMIFKYPKQILQKYNLKEIDHLCFKIIMGCFKKNPCDRLQMQDIINLIDQQKY